MKHFKNLFFFTTLCFTAITGLFSHAQNKEDATLPSTQFIEVNLSNEVISKDATESVTLTTYNTASFYVHNPKEFYIQKDTQFYIAEATNLIPIVTENKNQTAKTKIHKNTLQEVIHAKNKETLYQKQAPRLQEIPANNSQNYANSLGIANKLATSQTVTKTKTKSISNKAITTYTILVTTLPNHPKNNYYSNPTLGKYLQNKAPLYNKPPPCC